MCDPRYGWAAICTERFGSKPEQVCTEQNRAQHVADYEGDPRRRPLTPEELQAFFDYADDEVERIRNVGRKGALAAFRDAALFKVVYGWGLRRREAIMQTLLTCTRTRPPTASAAMVRCISAGGKPSGTGRGGAVRRGAGRC